jgi:uracil phosphoribosyltransferase
MDGTVLWVVQHPVLRQALASVRDRDLPSDKFRAQCHRAGLILLAAATRELRGDPDDVVLVPVLRAGLGFQDAALALLPAATTTPVGLWRDERTLEPHWYTDGVPDDLSGRAAIVLDPMLATGGTAGAVASRLRDRGATQIMVVCLICVEQGLSRLERDAGACEVFTAAQDQGLDEHGYILPGLGDAGDRLFGPKGDGAPAGFQTANNQPSRV